MTGTCPACGLHASCWWICSWGIIHEVVCLPCGAWAHRLMRELRRGK